MEDNKLKDFIEDATELVEDVDEAMDEADELADAVEKVAAEAGDLLTRIKYGILNIINFFKKLFKKD